MKLIGQDKLFINNHFSPQTFNPTKNLTEKKDEKLNYFTKPRNVTGVEEKDAQ